MIHWLYGYCVLSMRFGLGTRAFPVLYLSVRIRFLIGRHATGLLIINGWTDGVPDIDRMCNGQITDRKRMETDE